MNNFTFDFTTDYILENDVALLRPLMEDDFKYLLPFSLNEPTTWFYSLVTADGEDNLRNYMNIALQNRINKTEYPFIVFDKRTNEYAGCTRFYDINLSINKMQ